ncbi:MAG: N,N-dimethylformamidase beta subunit family domain-containing protein, partial [Reyranellaceae bacterium]
MSPWLWCYADRLSARPGESIGLHIAGTGVRCSIELAREGRERRIVHRIDGIAIAPHPVPDRVHVVGCGWPETMRLRVPADWPSGYYDIVLRADDGAEARHMLVVKAAKPAAPAAIVLATNTYQAYNRWGGANTY